MSHSSAVLADTKQTLV